MPHQLFRGMPAHLWKDAHPYGCSRHLTVFTKFNVIPKYCFECYKVVITPRNVMELFKLLIIFEKISLPLDNTRKCMVEERKDCSGTYKGLVYCKSINEGNEVCNIVRMMVSDDISPHVSVTLKRGCSEFEHIFPEFAQIKPASEAMQYRKDWQEYEDYADNKLVFYKEIYADIPYVNTSKLEKYTPGEILCIQYWLRYAATIGDISYLAITGIGLLPIPYLNRPPFKNSISL